jgi:hypothetical protein
MFATGFDHWAGGADSFRCCFAIGATRTALTIWMEEHLGWKFLAGTLILPFPL